VSASAPSAVFGQPVTLTADVTAAPGGSGTPTGGTVTFKDGAAALGAAGMVNGAATLTTSALAVGYSAVTASYSGDGSGFSASVSSAIGTAAGTGGGGYNGDNIPANTAFLSSPNGVAVNTSGDVFIADTLNNRVREVVQATGRIVTVAGTGAAGYNSDGVAATTARLSGPAGLALDAAGNLFIAEPGNNRVRLITSPPVVSIAPLSATFTAEDESTQGTWKRSYGTDGFAIPGDPSGTTTRATRPTSRRR
jgi:hypothetical protein